MPPVETPPAPGSVTVQLTKPVTVADHTYDALTLRPPTGADMVKCGTPFSIGTDGGITPLPAAVKKYGVALGGVLPAVIDQLSGPDFMALTQAVMAFFGDPAAS
jgi:hypothetical protein